MKMTRWFFCSLLLATVSLAKAEEMTAIEKGKELHDKNCLGCHAAQTNNNPARLYTRDNRKVNDKDALQKQVQYCNDVLGLMLFDEEIKNLVLYLNTEHYKFK
ncbi:MAG: cytochrome c [Candidatus Parabeggiatoa sp. nov. 2]|nr:MAG: cytochrome c [Gammaproteobacteria bacterium]